MKLKKKTVDSEQHGGWGAVENPRVTYVHRLTYPEFLCIWEFNQPQVLQ